MQNMAIGQLYCFSGKWKMGRAICEDSSSAVSRSSCSPSVGPTRLFSWAFVTLEFAVTNSGCRQQIQNQCHHWQSQCLPEEGNFLRAIAAGTAELRIILLECTYLQWRQSIWTNWTIWGNSELTNPGLQNLPSCVVQEVSSASSCFKRLGVEEYEAENS